MEKLDMLYEGKAKQVFKTDDEDKYIIYYKDDATAFNGGKKGEISQKGIINNKVSAVIFNILKKQGIPTHFEKLLSDRESLVKSVEIVPLEVIVRNVAAGSMSKRLGIEEGTILEKPVLEFCYKCDELNDPIINEDHIQALKLASEEEVHIIKAYTKKINEILIVFFKERSLNLIDFKLEFGIHKGEIVLADEISPDTCRLWDVNTNEKMDKDRFRRDLGNIEEAYKEVLSRME
ncbi:MAG: phosphoribosylaminoimidazolesuccinocarboxamide synthase [Anaeromicrobium sp.]|jgi:phosphoribosylaminoimidazole-succinocarboxamide synthase|uniref:phosphoribosylaminoimidazolesuccinocarboxamide synthase n=1 Tax=Anaeromicrobium sp. TaxID=1929132 RepID=UPI0025CEA7C8|nr:phosphoribosylaminoimidazolesuccinocarboxamide synthase [Anaeromicrobium sp.]MCT4593791.1 phosphoribosylaminoimidazolesuccinocarboxamide synthase [Anaeromicrobium sp.]